MRWPHLKPLYVQTILNVPKEKRLGGVQFVHVGDQITIANMVAQHGVERKNVPIRYNSLKRCLERVGEKARSLQASVHMPRIGCGLAGGKWEKIEPLIHQCLGGIPTFVYSFRGELQ